MNHYSRHESPLLSRIWLVNLYFGAGAAPTAPLLEGLARGLVQHGHQVEILSGRVGYNRASYLDGEPFPGRVHRLDCGPFQPDGLLGRLLCWASFFVQVCSFIFSRRLPHKVVVMTTPPFLHVLFAFRNLFARRPAHLILWNQDTYPEVLVAVGLLRPTSWVYRTLSAIQCWGTARVTTVVALDEAMRQRMQVQGARRVVVIPNWEGKTLTTTAMASGAGELIRRLREARSRYHRVILYTGNYGWGHDLGVVWDYLSRNPMQRDLFFLFVGGGEHWSVIERLSKQVDSLLATGYVARSEVRTLLAEADYGLVALDRTCLGLMSPSKIHTYLSCGVPLIYVGPEGSNVAEAITRYQCGLRIEVGDQVGWDQLTSEVCSPTFPYRVLAANALEASESRYGESAGVRDFLDLLA